MDEEEGGVGLVAKVVMLIPILIEGYLVWMMVPEHHKVRVRSVVKSFLAKLNEPQRRLADQRKLQFALVELAAACPDEIVGEIDRMRGHHASER
jgi:hypothetical protein